MSILCTFDALDTIFSFNELDWIHNPEYSIECECNFAIKRWLKTTKLHDDTLHDVLS